MEIHEFSYEVIYSAQFRGYVATCPQFPGIGFVGKTPQDALKGVQNKMTEVISKIEEAEIVE